MGAPLVLVSQIQRSGGHLLSELFDGHPQVYAHPDEVRIWDPHKGDWPQLDLSDDPSGWFKRLRHKRWVTISQRGFSNTDSNPHAAELLYPFTFSELAQREHFLRLVAERPVETQRDVLDAYFTSFFAAWQEWKPTGAERVISGFMPRLVMAPESVARFRADYPDGRLISVLRDPYSWFASSSRHSDHLYRELPAAIEKWRVSAQAIAAVAGEEWAAPVLFEELVSDPEPVMRRLAEFAGIDFDPILLQPTFLRRPMLPNSSFAVSVAGINPEMAKRRDQIDAEARDYIDRTAAPLYDEVAALVGTRVA